MPIEFDPPIIENIANFLIKKREGDVTCDQCGVLGGGSLPLIEAKDLGNKHAEDYPDHKVLVFEVRRSFP